MTTPKLSTAPQDRGTFATRVTQLLTLTGALYAAPGCGTTPEQTPAIEAEAQASEVFEAPALEEEVPATPAAVVAQAAAPVTPPAAEPLLPGAKDEEVEASSDETTGEGDKKLAEPVVNGPEALVADTIVEASTLVKLINEVSGAPIQAKLESVTVTVDNNALALTQPQAPVAPEQVTIPNTEKTENKTFIPAQLVMEGDEYKWENDRLVKKCPEGMVVMDLHCEEKTKLDK